MEPYQLIEEVQNVANELLSTDEYGIKQMEAIKDFANALMKRFKEIQLQILEDDLK